MKNGWTERIAELTESRDHWKREWRLLNAGLNMAEDKIKELEAERDKLRDDLSRDKAILQSLLDREHEEKRTLEDALTEERQRTRLSEAVIRENEVLTKDRDEWKRIALEGWWYE